MTTDPARGAVAERYLIDNSVWQRQRQPEVKAAMSRLVSARSPRSILVCPPIVAEVGFSARSGADHDAVLHALAAFPDCEEHPTSADLLDLQNALFNSGLVRAAGATDTLIAAYALANDATLVHYDRDYEFLARAEPALRHAWIAPPGSLPA
jgi:predicted nucleic acid-binding protein